MDLSGVTGFDYLVPFCIVSYRFSHTWDRRLGCQCGGCVRLTRRSHRWQSVIESEFRQLGLCVVVERARLERLSVSKFLAMRALGHHLFSILAKGMPRRGGSASSMAVIDPSAIISHYPRHKQHPPSLLHTSSTSSDNHGASTGSLSSGSSSSPLEGGPSPSSNHDASMTTPAIPSANGSSPQGGSSSRRLTTSYR